VTATAPGRLVLLGHPVSHSLSPAFQNAALRAAGIGLSYEAVDVSPGRLAAELGRLRLVRGAGNVTVPHKQAIARLCDRLTPLAERLGAVNTFWHEGGVLVGDNTDVAGFAAMADSLGVEPAGAVVACLGAGGAASAACAVVDGWPGARITLWSRGMERARELQLRFPAVVRCAHTPAEALDGATLVVNATPLGMRDESGPVDVALLPRDARVMDLVYRPGETRWVRAARAAGHRAADGREMLLRQGAAAFARWFGVAPDLAVMREALEAATSS